MVKKGVLDLVMSEKCTVIVDKKTVVSEKITGEANGTTVLDGLATLAEVGAHPRYLNEAARSLSGEDDCPTDHHLLLSTYPEVTSDRTVCGAECPNPHGTLGTPDVNDFLHGAR